MHRTALVVLAACSSSPSPSTSPSPTPVATPDAAVAADVAIDAAPPVDAAPAVDAELAAAPPFVFRFHEAGKVMTKAAPRLETWTLRQVGERATVRVQRMVPTAGDGWQPSSATVYLGTATDDGKLLTLALAATTNPNDKLALACTRAKLAVAAATAVRKPHPRKGKYAQPCSGDPGRWVPAKTKPVEVLSCKHPDYDAPMPFAPAPGVEYLYVNDDCDMQGGDYRAIPADGTIAPVR